ncbi:uncharacterized protein N7529_005118 [Penicillium soppii]|uniref:uncharacterized protein n=1 Tax=Penicillium soppii TaxID=69789 RepID=UPI0025484035|nr:uncharacterized protein N7529_005118 [Penicillium soppii]KAJ5872765.1 hypothetical protein N7529_005118 [Penicillium soppii]
MSEKLKALWETTEKEGPEHGHRMADASLREEDIADCRTQLTDLILRGTMSTDSLKSFDATDVVAHNASSSSLMNVQKRLIQANIIRRSRIEFDTLSMSLSRSMVKRSGKTDPSYLASPKPNSYGIT